MQQDCCTRILQTFPWDMCRRIYTDPRVNTSFHVSGASADWEMLLSSAFLDAKTIIMEWLVLQKALEGIFEDFGIASSADPGLRRAVLSRCAIYHEVGYYDMLAMASCYFCTFHVHEQELFSLFAECMKSNESIGSESVIREAMHNSASSSRHAQALPDWQQLPRWLQRVVHFDLFTIPASLAAAAVACADQSTRQVYVDAMRAIANATQAHGSVQATSAETAAQDPNNNSNSALGKRVVEEHQPVPAVKRASASNTPNGQALGSPSQTPHWVNPASSYPSVNTNSFASAAHPMMLPSVPDPIATEPFRYHPAMSGMGPLQTWAVMMNNVHAMPLVPSWSAPSTNPAPFAPHGASNALA